MIETFTREAIVTQIGTRLGSKLRQRIRVSAIPHGGPEFLAVRIVGRPYATDMVLVTVRREGERLIGGWRTLYDRAGSASIICLETLARLVVDAVLAFEDEWSNPPNPYAALDTVFEIDDERRLE